MNCKLHKIWMALALGVILGVSGSSALAICTVAGNTATPFQVGPPSPVNGFPEYVRDASGLSLELCLSPSAPVGTAPFCFFDPPDGAIPFSQQIGFGFEAFWWLATPDTKAFPANVGAVLVLGAEAAFAADIVDGGQFPFTRLRITLDVPSTGFYRITEPYGEHVYSIPTVGPGREVFDSFDVEFTQGTIDAAGTVTEATSTDNCVGPWLTWDTFPSNDPALDNTGDTIPDFIGDGATPHLITGSPTGKNLFKIEAFSDAELTIPIDLNGTNINGSGKNGICTGDGTVGLGPDNFCNINSDCDASSGSGDGICDLNGLQTNLFTVVGKLYDGRLATQLVPQRSTYARDASGLAGQADVFARSTITANVGFSGGANVDGPHPLFHDAGGNFFNSEPLFPDGSVVPATVQLDATNGGGSPTDPTTLVRPLVDQVTITRAEYDVATAPPTLTVEAQSSDVYIVPTLTLVNVDQPLAVGSISVTEASPGVLITPPGTATVASSAGGSDTRLVEVIDSTDTDNDGVRDEVDNCINVANGTLLPVPGDPAGNSQRDTDSDGYGNMCDADLTQDGIVSLADFGVFRAAFGSAANPDSDFNGDGIVSLADFGIFRSQFGKAPGPSCCGIPLP